MYWTLGLYSITVNGIPQFQAANPAAGARTGTSFTAAWFNDVQGELLNILAAAGVAPAQNTPTQVLESVTRLTGVPRRSQRFTSNGNFTGPNFVTTGFVTIAGGGGGGGGSSVITGAGGGGGSGDCQYRVPVTLVPGQVYSVTVGAGGTPGTSGGTNGGNGGDSVFGTEATAAGGGGGTGATSAGGYFGQASGGAPGGLGGQQGADGFGNSTYQASGTGGSNLLGSGGQTSPSVTGPGLPGIGFGAGGGGGGGLQDGGSGAPGTVIVEW